MLPNSGSNIQIKRGAGVWFFSAILAFSLFWLLPTLSYGQEGFGRFGYTNAPNIFGFTLSQSGLKNRYSGSDTLSFPVALPGWKALVTSPYRQVLGVTDTRGILLNENVSPGMPSKIRMDIFDYGVSMYFPRGIRLKMNSTASPFLTWKEGSVTQGVPTPNTAWVALSYQDPQPPVVLGFPDEQTGLQIEGELGNWTLRSTSDFKGWVRFSLPFGLTPVQAISASGLGKIATRCEAFETVWYSPIADTPDPSIEEDSFGVTLEFQSPRKNPVVPTMLYFAELGGYAAKIYSPYSFFPDRNEEGPILLSNEGTIRFRLPVRRIPAGRGLTIGEPIPQILENATWDSPLKVVDLALANTLSGRSWEVSERARDLVNTYFERVKPQKEPISQQTVLYSETGEGMLETAVHGLLSQSIRTGVAEEADEDPQLLCLQWRLDPYTGRLGVGVPGMTNDASRRIKAIAAIAGAFSSRPKMRALAGMFQCALSAEKGSLIWFRRQLVPKSADAILEPMLGVRKAIFALIDDVPLDPVVSNWQSEVRCYGDTPVWLQMENGNYQVIWNTRDKLLGQISFDAAFRIKLSSRSNIQSMFVRDLWGGQEIKYQPLQVGQCAANLTVPFWIRPLPITALPPTYSELKSSL